MSINFKQILATILIICICSSCNIQSKTLRKNIHYVNAEGIVVSEHKFNKETNRSIFVTENKTDSGLVKKINNRLLKGNLSKVQLKTINNYLQSILGSDFDPNKETMVHYYENDKPALEKATNDLRHWGYIENNKERIQSFLIISPNSEIIDNSSIKIYKDIDNLLMPFVFSESIFKINHFFIEPNGEIRIFFGLDDILYVLDGAI